jgi:hypothetical protein
LNTSNPNGLAGGGAAQVDLSQIGGFFMQIVDLFMVIGAAELLTLAA